MSNVSIALFSPAKETLWDEIQFFNHSVDLPSLFQSSLLQHPEHEYNRQSGSRMARLSFDSSQLVLNGVLVFENGIELYVRSSNISFSNVQPPWYSTKISTIDSRLTSAGGDVFVSGVVSDSFLTFCVLSSKLMSPNPNTILFYSPVLANGTGLDFKCQFPPLLPYANFYTLSVRTVGFPSPNPFTVDLNVVHVGLRCPAKAFFCKSGLLCIETPSDT